jgi:glycosyltransferase involved in cell wall biosynthesis
MASTASTRGPVDRRAHVRAASRLRIAMLAPPWLPVPPTAYGGTENVIALLCDALVTAGHEVTLFAAPHSRSSARVRPLLADEHPEEMGLSLYEADHVARAFDLIEDDASYDVVHDHSGFTALVMADRLTIPLVHTVHGSFAPSAALYQQHGHKAVLVALSRSHRADAPRGVEIAAVTPNPLRVEDWPLRTDKQGYLLWVGRCAPCKAPDHAVAAARIAGRRLVLAGPIQCANAEYFATAVAPHIDDAAVCFVGEVGGQRKRELFAGAAALLMPLRWHEPFGMVMVEALACGTPVVAYREGSAAEIVMPGVNGFLVEGVEQMAQAVGRLGEIDPVRCRDSVSRRFAPDVVADRYVQVYRRAIEARVGAHHGPAAAPR